MEVLQEMVKTLRGLCGQLSERLQQATGLQQAVALSCGVLAFVEEEIQPADGKWRGGWLLSERRPIVVVPKEWPCSSHLDGVDVTGATPTFLRSLGTPTWICPAYPFLLNGTSTDFSFLGRVELPGEHLQMSMALTSMQGSLEAAAQALELPPLAALPRSAPSLVVGGRWFSWFRVSGLRASLSGCEL